MGRAKLTRKEALRGVPAGLPVVSQEDTDGGGVRLYVRLSRPPWQRWFGLSETAERKFDLDSLGREVYESCDGRRDVRSIVEAFRAAHRLSRVEAEISVTTFIRMLIGKGLVAMQVPVRRTAKFAKFAKDAAEGQDGFCQERPGPSGGGGGVPGGQSPPGRNDQERPGPTGAKEEKA